MFPNNLFSISTKPDHDIVLGFIFSKEDVIIYRLLIHALFNNNSVTTTEPEGYSSVSNKSLMLTSSQNKKPYKARNPQNQEAVRAVNDFEKGTVSELPIIFYREHLNVRQNDKFSRVS